MRDVPTSWDRIEKKRLFQVCIYSTDLEKRSLKGSHLNIHTVWSDKGRDTSVFLAGEAGEQLAVWEMGSSKLGGAGCPQPMALPAAAARTLHPRLSDGTEGVTARSSRVIGS